MRIEAARPPGWYDLVHSHYWLSGQVAWLAAERWDVPLVHSMHTMAKVKNLTLADGDDPEPAARAIGEAQVVEAADRLVANTDEEAPAARRASTTPTPSRVAVVPPGRRPRPLLARARDPPPAGRLGAAGRRLPSCCSSAGSSRSRRPTCCCAPPPGWSSATRRCATGWSSPSSAVRPAAGWPGPSRCSAGRRARPRRRGALRAAGPAGAPADWYRAADLTVVPSYSESFGLVAIESQACGTPVVAASVGGLRTAVADGVSGVLVDGHDPERLRRRAGRPGSRPGPARAR